MEGKTTQFYTSRGRNSPGEPGGFKAAMPASLVVSAETRMITVNVTDLLICRHNGFKRQPIWSYGQINWAGL
ncbi:MAG TPA: hypothetical protein VLX29_07070 [Nitrospirota bacterium]|nr:hypothetical protein [Nitrospirota bacterium]